MEQVNHAQTMQTVIDVKVTTETYMDRIGEPARPESSVLEYSERYSERDTEV